MILVVIGIINIIIILNHIDMSSDIVKICGRYYWSQFDIILKYVVDNNEDIRYIILKYVVDDADAVYHIIVKCVIENIASMLSYWIWY